MHFNANVGLPPAGPDKLPLAYRFTVADSRYFRSTVALHVVSKEKMSFAEAVVGGSIMGMGIAGMHYIGMAAMRLAAAVRFDPRIVTLSVLIAIVSSVIALLLAFDLREETKETTPRKVSGAMAVATGICLMHYTGMAAARFMPAAIKVQSIRCCKHLGTRHHSNRHGHLARPRPAILTSSGGSAIPR